MPVNTRPFPRAQQLAVPLLIVSCALADTMAMQQPARAAAVVVAAPRRAALSVAYRTHGGRAAPPTMVLSRVRGVAQTCARALRSASEARPLATPTVAFAIGVATGIVAAPTLLGLFVHYNTVDDIPADLFKTKAKIPGVVVKVNDGDTFRVRHTGGVLPSMDRHKSKAEGGKKKLSESTLQIRIAAVDCPETAKFGNKGQAFGDTATDFVQETIGNKKVTVKLLARDQYQRAVSSVTYRDGPLGLIKRDLSEELLKRGLAQVYRQGGAQYDGPVDRWDKLEEKAKKDKVGIWKDGKSVDPAAYKKALKEQKGE